MEFDEEAAQYNEKNNLLIKKLLESHFKLLKNQHFREFSLLLQDLGRSFEILVFKTFKMTL